MLAAYGESGRDSIVSTFGSVGDAEQLAAVTYNADGLVPAIVQEHATGEVLMMAWMNEETLRETLESGRTVFWSRSRQQRWRKGERYPVLAIERIDRVW